jgi:hypothetical protein
MKNTEADRAEAAEVFQMAIEPRYMELSKEPCFRKEHETRIRALPLNWQKELSKRLALAPLVPTRHDERANSIVVQLLHQFDDQLKAKERTEFNEKFPMHAKMEIDPS